jgi:hypothetical protein
MPESRPEVPAPLIENHILQSSLNAASSTSVSAAFSTWIKLAGTVLSRGKAANPAFGVIGRVYNVIGTATAPKAVNQSAIPNTFAAYETTVAGFVAWGNAYTQDLRRGLDTVIDNIYSDWAKLQAVSRSASHTDSAWFFPNQAAFENLDEPAVLGAKQHLYLQLLPSTDSFDYWPADKAQTPEKIGTVWIVGNQRKCDSFYDSVSLFAWSWQSYPSAGQPRLTDIFVVVDLKNSPGSFVGETFPSADLTTKTFDPQGELRLTRDLFFSPNGPLKRGNGPGHSPSRCTP